MNKLKKNFTIILLFIFIFILFKYNYILNTSVVDAVNLWLTKVFPSLFIMFILNDIIINTNILNNVVTLINPIFNAIFNTSGSSSQAFLLSLFSGTPTSAFIIKEMLAKNTITSEDANKLIAFTYFSNPLFLYNILTLSFNKFITIKIILIHYLTNIIIGLIFRNKKNNYLQSTIYENNTHNKIFPLIPNAIKKSVDTLIMILGTITFYMIITNLITNIFNLSPIIDIFTKGLLEITQSLNILNDLNTTSIIKEIIAISIISFGGLSIHSQVLSLISDTNISYKNFFIARLLHGIISAAAYFFISCHIIS
ncbi:MAG: hypothetical protein E7161_04575 [Firmicutes bacterium]|nr:hypothetical protein [Bacillota bacterium]